MFSRGLVISPQNYIAPLVKLNSPNHDDIVRTYCTNTKSLIIPGPKDKSINDATIVAMNIGIINRAICFSNTVHFASSVASFQQNLVNKFSHQLNKNSISQYAFREHISLWPVNTICIAKQPFLFSNGIPIPKSS